MIENAYVRAEALLPGRAEHLILGGEVEPRFLPGSDRFCFTERTADGERTLVVDPDLGSCQETADDSREPLGGEWSISPDQRWAVRVVESNIEVLDRDTGERRQVTNDGSAERPYASRLDWYSVQRRLRGLPEPPVISWSPDSSRFVMERNDQSLVAESQVAQIVEGEPRPRVIGYRDPLAGDSELATSSLHVVELGSGEVTAVRLDPLRISDIQPILFGHVWFSPRGERIEAVLQGRDQRQLWLVSIDPASGAARTVAEQRGPTVTEPNLLVWDERPAARVLDDGRGLWLSERDGWAHLWLVDGESWTQVTCGEWVVRELLHVDEASGQILFSASGREAAGSLLDRRLYRVGLDGGEPLLITPEPVDHQAVVSPSGRWIVDAMASPQVPPVTVLRDAEGEVTQELSRADISRLEIAGWRAPTPFAVVAADGETELHGVLYLPPDFDEEESWPLLDVVYPGPQIGVVPRRFGLSEFQFDSFAQLGLVVMALNARGTPLRSKDFHDTSYGALESSHAIADHAAAVRQLAQRHPWIDAERVGITGNSGGGAMTARAMFEQPETFKVGVSGVGNHDNRRYCAGWGERYIGLVEDDPTAWRRQSNVPLADQLRGHLQLCVAELDTNVHPSNSRALIAALVAADIDHDVVLLPDADHAACVSSPYYVRRVWDYLVTHLIGEVPPAYSIAPESMMKPQFFL